jgi:hypothetical protein
LPDATSTATKNAGPKSPLDPYTTSPRRIASPKWTRILLENQSSSTFVWSPLRRRRSTRLPPSYAEETKSRLPSPHTGVEMFRLYCVRWGCFQKSGPPFGSTPATPSPWKSTSCSCPSTVIRTGEAGAMSNVWFFQATWPSLCLKATRAWPAPPTGRMTLSP